MILLDFPNTKLNSTRRLFNELKKLPEFKSLSDIENLSIINLDTENLHHRYNNAEFYDKHFGLDKYRVMIVHDLHKDSMPFIKCADLLIFFNENQQKLFHSIMKMDIPSWVIPYPKPQETIVPTKRQILFCTDFDPTQIENYTHVVNTWNLSTSDDSFVIIEPNTTTAERKSSKSYDLKHYKFTMLFVVDPLLEAEFDQFSLKLEADLHKNFTQYEIKTIDSYCDNTIQSYLNDSEFVYVFNREMSQSQFDELIEKESTQIIYTNIRENFMLARSIGNGRKIIIPEGVSTANMVSRPTPDQYLKHLRDAIILHKELIADDKKYKAGSIIKDRLSSLSIIDGQPISNKYVFVVNYRNQAPKILRCLSSLIDQSKHLNFGIVITDDASTDGSLELVKPFMKRSDVDYVIVKNKVRKYVARNLYNAVHLLCTNPDSVIIEVDGDDFLNGNIVLDIIDEAYSNGCDKTHGSFMTFPEQWTEMESNINNLNFTEPWHQGKCASWVPLRTYKKSLFDKVEIDYFLDRNKKWLTYAHDASINPRMIQLAKKIEIISDVIYVYDISGNMHDIDQQEEWSPLPSYRDLYHVITF